MYDLIPAGLFPALVFAITVCISIRTLSGFLSADIERSLAVSRLRNAPGAYTVRTPAPIQGKPAAQRDTERGISPYTGI